MDWDWDRRLDTQPADPTVQAFELLANQIKQEESYE